jgi:VCBS repeat protein
LVALPGDGGGAFGAPEVILAEAELRAPNEFLPGATGATVLDLNGDGRADVLASTSFPLSIGSSIRALISTAGGFVEARSYNADWPGPLRFADFDADGRPDLVSAGFHRALDGHTFVTVFVTPAGVAQFGDGGGGFEPGPTVLSGSPTSTRGGPWPVGPAEAGVGDLDGDGRPDVLVAPGRLLTSPPVLLVLRNLGGRQFGGPVEVPLPAPARGAAVDLNGDGAADLVLDAGSQPQTIAIEYAVPILNVRDRHEFADQTVGAAGGSVPLEIENQGRAPLTLAGAAIVGPQSADFALTDDGCSGRTLQSGGTCALGVRFSPSAAGPRAAELRLTPRAGAGRSVALSGYAVQPTVTPPTGSPLPVVRSSCSVRRGPRARVICTVVLRRTAGVHVALRLVRGGWAYARADVRAGGRVGLRALRPLRAGRYALVTVVTDGRQTRQARRRLVVRPAALR